jgi:hypothetical protein
MGSPHRQHFHLDITILVPLRVHLCSFDISLMFSMRGEQLDDVLTGLDRSILLSTRYILT